MIRRRPDHRVTLSPQLRLYLETGDYTGGPDHPADFDVYRMAGAVICGDFAALAEVWGQHGDAVMKSWAAAYAGARPFAWWAVAAPEPRRVVRGAALLARSGPLADRWWRHQFGEPRFIAARPRGAALPLVEAEAEYLRRLDLLRPGERAELDTEAFEPVEVNPFHLTEEDVDSRGCR